MRFRFSKKGRKVVERIDEDPTGLSRAVLDFNRHVGPAKIFYNRHSKTFTTNTSNPGEDDWWSEDMACGMDVVELYRKTTAAGGTQITREALKLMEGELPPYSVW